MGQQVGLVGLAVMGENLALNIERNGFSLAVHNRGWERTATFLAGRGAGRRIVGTRTLAELAQALERPRRIILMVKAGDAVDQVVRELRSHLEPGDVVVDGGNSHYPDTDRRIADFAPTGVVFFGMGVSGGEEGALHGPSLMPGGDRATYATLEPILTRIAAKADSGPCVTYVGTGSAGHFTKMVHNGIEYGDMQLIAETYDILRHAGGLEPAEIAEVFAEWNEGELSSFLVEVTARVLAFRDDQGGRRALVDRIRDAAGQKGTGKWTTTAALDLGVPIPTITAAVDARILSAMADVRGRAAKAYRGPAVPRAARRTLLGQLRSALYAAKICSYAQGFDLLRHASSAFHYGLDLAEIARIWKGGCIIRAAFLDRIRQAFGRDGGLPNLLLDADFAKDIRRRADDWRAVVSLAARGGMTPPALAASLAYFDAVRRPRLPTNLIQAQRDFFGAHTYERVDRPGIFHTDWSSATLPSPARRRR
ncbi:MAG: NADP-dependent phosphogluconate dehydrogenase [Candidatus Binatia bacterium]